MRSVTRALARGVAVLMAASVALVGGAGPAVAHNTLVSSVPAKGAKLAVAPKSVRLTFLEALDPPSTKITIIGPGGVNALAGAPRFTRNVVDVGLTAGAAGGYTVAYQLASDDGHPIRGKVTFTLTQAAAPSPTAAPVATGTPSAAPSSTPAVAASPASLTDDEKDPYSVLWSVLGALAAAAALMYALRRRRKADSPGR
ncbi:copper resistance CopC family protein [Pilimelia columellifera]|uniref:CopC domain-containing protein n=1 Tax=Pilimelia columellifera subsp. columellifera TaxID=706583 RepID=A0ABN3NIR2_9ACTN